MSKDKIDETTKKNKKGKLRERFLKVVLLVLIIFLINLYIILRILYEGDNFTVTLDSEFGKESNLKIYENLDKKLERTFLRSEDIDFLSDISINWIPADIHNQGEGSHNGPHFIAYTFYVENEGKETINYWKMIEIDNVARDVDKAIRVMIYRNDEERVIYAKTNSSTGQPEEGTKPFKDDKTVMLEATENFKPGDLDKYTVVIWVEGDDPDCTNDLIGGRIDMHMTLTEEHIAEDN